MWLLADDCFSFLILSFESEIHLDVYDLCDPMDWVVACQAPLSMEFSRQEYWSGLPFPTQPYHIFMQS